MSDSASPQPDASGEDPASAAIADYFMRLDRGERVDRDEFIAEHTDIADQLREFFEGANLVEQFAGPTFAEQTIRLSMADTARSQVINETVPGLTASQASTLAYEPVADVALPQELGRYRLDRVIGRGAMGTVYLAHDQQLHRDVALKIPRFEVDGSRDELMQRFFREARSVALLRDSGICPVYDVDEVDGIHFITMAYIEGQPLSHVLRDGRKFEPREAAVLVMKVARALGKAHEHGIVHRDVKPGNVMIDRDNEPVIMDFGLAARLDMEDVRVTQHGTLLGTPAYMSPEQVAGDPEAISASSDVFSLGVILYELLAGRLPFEGTILQIAHQITNDDPPALSNANPNLDSALVDICSRMVAKQPEDRFASMEDVASALRGFLMHGNDDTKPSKEGRPRSSNGRVAFIAGAAMLLLASMFFAIDNGFKKPFDTHSPIIANNANSGTHSEPSSSTPGNREHINIPHSPSLDSGFAVNPRGTTVVDVEVSKNGQFFVAADSTGSVALHLLPNGQQSQRFNEYVDSESRPPLSHVVVDVSNDASQVAAAWGDSLTVWSATDARIQFDTKPGGTVLDVAFSPDGSFVLTSTDQGEMQLWQTDNGTLERRFQRVPYGIQSVSFSSDGRYIFSGESQHEPQLQERVSSGRRLLKQWNVETGELLRVFHGETGGVASLAIAPDGRSLLTGGEDGIVRRWDLDNGQVVQRFLLTGRVADVEYAPSGDYFAASSSVSRRLHFWQLSPMQELFPERSLRMSIGHLAFAPDGRRLIAAGVVDNMPGGTQGTVLIRDLKGDLDARPTDASADALPVPHIETVIAQPLQRLRGHTDEVLDIEFLHRDGEAFSAGRDGTLRHWSITAGRLLNTHEFEDGGIRDLALSPDDRLLAAGHQNGAVNLVSTTSGEVLLQLDGHRDPVDSLHFSPDGSQLASAARDGFVRVWSVDDGTLQNELRADPVANWTVRFLAGQRLFAAGERHSRLWDLTTERVLKTFGTNNQLYFGAEPAPDGQRVVYGNYDGQIGVWSFDGDASGVLIGQHSRFVSLSKQLAGDGRFAVTGGAESVLVTDLEEGNTVYRLNLGQAGAGVLALSPDERFLLVTARDPYLEGGPQFALQLFELPLFVRRSVAE